jgi:SAM-dependent methyltransferase
MSFGAVAEDYDRLRPSPPQDAVDWLLPANCQVAVDVAAGTGALTRVLAGKVPQVVAVEPDERMRAVLRARSPGAAVVEGRGEAIPMPDASADGVFVSSAWHWMDPGLAIPEIGRVLRAGGRFGAVWTGRDREAGWLRELDWAQWDRPDRGEPDRDGTGQPGETGQPGGQGAARSRRGHREVTLPGTGAPGAGLFGNAETAMFRFTLAMTISDFVGMLATYSRLIIASPEDRAAALARARAAVEGRFPGASEIDVPMRTWCWRADRADRAAP